jgi:hypothetical protein
VGYCGGITICIITGLDLRTIGLDWTTRLRKDVYFDAH